MADGPEVGELILLVLIDRHIVGVVVHADEDAEQIGAKIERVGLLSNPIIDEK